MWLTPAFPHLSRAALRTYYRFRSAGGSVPARGPVLLVANHPNSLLDPAAVCAVAARPVRFLAKAPLFHQRGLAWLVRACGAIPVYRRQDDPSLVERNEEAFRAAWEALAAGHAVGIFPEGKSHSEPALEPLKTGAARIALGAARLGARAFPIIPVGLVLPHKERFRSRALAVVGEPVTWGDLPADPEDEGAVRELTARIERALRAVTLNLERWEDAPVVECAEAIYAAEFALPADPAERLRRLGQVSEALVRLRRASPDRLAPLYRQIARYAELLAALGLRPHRVGEAPSPGAAARWTVRQLAFFGLLAPLALVGAVIFVVPYRLTALLPGGAAGARDVHATVKVLGGALVYGAWILLLSSAVWLAAGPAAAAAGAAGLPLLGLLTLLVRDRWEGTRANARAYLLLRSRERLRRRLVERRGELASRLEGLRRELEAERSPAGAPTS